MTKTYNTEPTTIEEAKATISEIILDLTGLETKITKTAAERDQKTKEWQELSSKLDAAEKKLKNSKLNTSSLPPSTEILSLRQQVADLQTENANYSRLARGNQATLDSLNSQKTALEDKIKELESKQTTEQTPSNDLNKYVKYGVVGLEVLAIGLLIIWLIRKIFQL